ncbi:MAG: EamA family transporter [Bacteroidetes bacterium]|nr:MAG: EamA family transporter [Bacteroidota bacterium]
MTGSTTSKLSLGWVLLLLLTLIWGSSFILIKRGLDVFDAGEVGALRMFAASLVLSPLAIKHFKSFTRRQYFYLFFVGFVGSFIPAFLFAKAETGLSSAMAGVLNALTPMFVVIVGSLFFSQQIGRRTIVGLLIGFGGTAVLMLAGTDGELSKLNFFGLYILVATIMYGTNVNIIKYRLHGIKSIPLTSMAFTLILPFAAGYLFLASDFVYKLNTVPGAGMALFYVSILGVIGTALAMVLFNKLIQFVSPIFASSVTYLIPIVAVAWGLFDNEVLLTQHYIGMLIILVGVYITNRK